MGHTGPGLAGRAQRPFLRVPTHSDWVAAFDRERHTRLRRASPMTREAHDARTHSSRYALDAGLKIIGDTRMRFADGDCGS